MILGLCCLPTGSVKASSPSRTLLALDDQAKFPDPKGNYVQLHVAIYSGYTRLVGSSEIESKGREAHDGLHKPWPKPRSQTAEGEC